MGGVLLDRGRALDSVETLVGDLIMLLGKANRELYELKGRVEYLESLLQKPVTTSSPDSTLTIEREMAQ